MKQETTREKARNIILKPQTFVYCGNAKLLQIHKKEHIFFGIFLIF